VRSVQFLKLFNNQLTHTFSYIIHIIIYYDEIFEITEFLDGVRQIQRHPLSQGSL
jgi:hypothetical protein